MKIILIALILCSCGVPLTNKEKCANAFRNPFDETFDSNEMCGSGIQEPQEFMGL